MSANITLKGVFLSGENIHNHAEISNYSSNIMTLNYIFC